MSEKSLYLSGKTDAANISVLDYSITVWICLC